LFGKVFRDPQLLRLNFGILVLHLILTASFVVLPLVLRDAGVAPERHWQVYLPVLVASIGAMIPFIILAERHRRMKQVFLGAVLALGLSELGMMWWHQRLFGVAAMLVTYFAAVNLLEASLPSLVSKIAPPDSKGTAMGFYATFQFLGAFLGGWLGGWLSGLHGASGVFGLCAAAALAWLLVAGSMKHPRYLSSQLLKVGVMEDSQAQRLAMRLTQVRGVAEAVVIGTEGVAYLKVDRHALDHAALSEFSLSDG
jgi:MFS family permease